MRLWKILGLVFMVAAQLAAPLSMVISQEAILSKGRAFKFKTRPVDPEDPFRGNYLRLDFEAGQLDIDSLVLQSKHWKFADETVSVHRNYLFGRQHNDNIFLILGSDSLGFAKIQDISLSEPTGGDYIEVLVRSIYKKWSNDPEETKDKFMLSFEYPFERFYLEESKAKPAEDSYRQANRDSLQIAFALVKIKDGKSAIEDVIVNGKSVREIVREKNSRLVN